MGRIRSIHPGIFTDEAFMSISAHARVLLFGLWCESDDQGVFEWKPLTLKARLLPADLVDATELLQELVSVDVIQAFEAGGKRFGVLRNFGRYQRPKAPKRVHPLPEELQVYAAVEGKGVTEGPMNHPRDVTATDRQRAKRERDRDLEEMRHGLDVTDGEMSRQREEGGGITLANANGDAKASPLSTIDEIWIEQVPILTALSGAKETTVRQRVGKALSKFPADDVRNAFARAIEAKSGDPLAYATRVLIPDPQARGSPKQDCASAASDLAERLSDDTFAQPMAHPMLAAVRG